MLRWWSSYLIPMVYRCNSVTFREETRFCRLQKDRWWKKNKNLHIFLKSSRYLHVFGLSGLDELISLDPGSRFLGTCKLLLVGRVGEVDWLVLSPYLFSCQVCWFVWSMWLGHFGDPSRCFLITFCLCKRSWSHWSRGQKFCRGVDWNSAISRNQTEFLSSFLKIDQAISGYSA